MSIRAKFPGRCSVCHRHIPAGTMVEWEKASRSIRHIDCATSASSSHKAEAVATTPKSLDPVRADEILREQGRKWAGDAAGWSRPGKSDPELGSVFAHRDKAGSERHYMVIRLGTPYYHSEDECEDMDCFCGRYGWQTGYDARPVTASASERELEQQRVAAIQVAEDARKRRDQRFRELAVPPEGWLFLDGAAIPLTVTITSASGTECFPNQPVTAPPKDSWTLLDSECETDATQQYARLYQAGEYRVLEHGDWDDWRTAIMIPPHLVDSYLAAEVVRQGITCEAAQQWLLKSRGCVGTPIYEFAAR